MHQHSPVDSTDHSSRSLLNSFGWAAGEGFAGTWEFFRVGKQRADMGGTNGVGKTTVGPKRGKPFEIHAWDVDVKRYEIDLY